MGKTVNSKAYQQIRSLVSPARSAGPCLNDPNSRCILDHRIPQDTTGGIPAVGSTSCSRSDKTFFTTGSLFQLKGAAKACSASQHMMILRTEGDAQSVGCHHKKLKHGPYMGGS